MLLFSNDSKHIQFFVTDRFVSDIYLKLRQGRQLPDFSLRSQTFCFTADFLYACPISVTFSHSITKQPASTLEFQYFYSILQMNFCEPRQKREERPFSAGTSCAWAGL